MDTKLKKLLKAYQPYFRVEEDGRVTCLPNGHSFLPKFDVISAFVK
jgi:hypothetical protein